MTTINGNDGRTFNGMMAAGEQATVEFTNTPPTVGIVVSKEANKATVEAGQAVTYTVTVTNTGGARMENIVVTDTFEGASGELEFTLPDGVTQNADGSFTIAVLPARDSVSITAKYTARNADVGKTLTNSVTASAEGVAPVAATETVTVKEPDESTPDDDVVPPMLNGEEHFAYIIGYEDGTVRPEGSITRAEVATIIFRLLKDEVRDNNLTTVNSLTDVNEGDWYNMAVSTLVKLDIISGRSEPRLTPMCLSPALSLRRSSPASTRAAWSLMRFHRYRKPLGPREH